MFLDDEELRELARELSKVFGEKAMAVWNSYMLSVYMKVGKLEKSRDNWRRKYKELKNKNG